MNAKPIETAKLARNRLGVVALSSSLLGTVFTIVVLWFQQLPNAVRHSLLLVEPMLFIVTLLLNLASAILGLVGFIWRPRRYGLLTLIALPLDMFLLGLWLQVEIARMP